MYFAQPRPELPAGAPARSILWLLANPIDCDALGLWCKSHIVCDIVETAADLETGFRRCEVLQPTLLVLDPSMSEAAASRGVAALQKRCTGHLLLFDRRPREGRVVEILAEQSVSYLSRFVSPTHLAGAIEGILARGTRAIDPAFSHRLRRTPRGYEFYEPTLLGSVAGLSRRERQVMRLLAQGKSVADCAKLLGLAHSTIDNHKSRLMKKLNIHKASELTCRAIRDGLIAI